jgi:SAM-dependent methyltransferase
LSSEEDVVDSEYSREFLPPTQAVLFKAAYGAQIAQVLYVAAKLGIADQLTHSDQTAHELASTLRVNESALQRILRGLVGVGACEETSGGRFRLTSMGEYLRQDHPGSMCARLLLNGEVHYRLWTEILETVRSGEPASPRSLGMPFYGYLANNPEVGRLFDRTMASAVQYRHRPTVEAYNFGQYRVIVDVGGGNATLMTEIMAAYHEPLGIVFDVPRLADAARKTIEAAGLVRRCRFMGGDALDEVPTGGDAYVFSNIVLNWEDDEAIRALRNCRKVMARQGRLLLVEWITPRADEPKDSFRFWDTVMMDLVMLVTFGSRRGRVRTEEEFQALLNEAGFIITSVIPTTSSVWVVEAVPN